VKIDPVFCKRKKMLGLARCWSEEEFDYGRRRVNQRNRGTSKPEKREKQHEWHGWNTANELRFLIDIRCVPRRQSTSEFDSTEASIMSKVNNVSERRSIICDFHLR